MDGFLEAVFSPATKGVREKYSEILTELGK